MARDPIYVEQLEIFFPTKPSRLYDMLDKMDFDSMAKGLDLFFYDEGGRSGCLLKMG
jgi:hypothetical protein